MKSLVVADGEEKPDDGTILLTGPVIVRDFAEMLELKPNQLIGYADGHEYFCFDQSRN